VREEDGSVRDLTPGENVKADLLGWSADGATFWITSNARDPQVFDLYAYDTATYESRLVYENPGMFISAISRDGRWLAMDKPITSADSDVYVVDLQSGGEPVLITEHEGNVAHGTYDFTPDSAALIYATNAHGDIRLVQVLSEPGSNTRQQFIPDRVTKAVIDGLEAVEIDEDDAETVSGGDPLTDGLHKRRAIEKAGQRVAVRRIDRRLFGEPAFAHFSAEPLIRLDQLGLAHRQVLVLRKDAVYPQWAVQPLRQRRCVCGGCGHAPRKAVARSR